VASVQFGCASSQAPVCKAGTRHPGYQVPA
jgi:hypothetical protein